MELERIVHSRPDRELHKRVITKGECDVVPVEDAKCRLIVTELRYRDVHGPCVFNAPSALLDRAPGPLHWTLGAADTAIDRDFELVVRQMTRGERCVARLKYRGPTGNLVCEITCELHLVEVSIEPLVADWPRERLISMAERHKERGIALVKERRLVDAFLMFSKALKLLLALEPMDVAELPEHILMHLLDLKVKLYNNLAHCQLEARQYKSAVELATLALSLRPRDAKALYRRGAAQARLGLHEEAWADLQAAAQQRPHDAATRRALADLEPTIRRMNRDYTAFVKKMFS